MMLRMIFRMTALGIGLFLTLIAVMACQPVHPVHPVDSQDPQLMRSAGDGESSTLHDNSNPICTAVPQQRLVSGPVEEIQRTVPGLIGSQGVVNNVWVRAQYLITFPTFNGVQTAGTRQIVMLVEGTDVGLAELEKSLSSSQSIIVTPNHYAYVIEGGGQSGGHTPFGTSPVPALLADSDDFEQQWAMQDIHQTEMYSSYQHINDGGDGVIVGIFDSSPFQYLKWTPPFFRTQTLTATSAVATNAYTISLTNHYTPVSGTGIDHGVFVAGLLHAIAPQAELHLYRSFNDSGLTDEFTLGTQFNQFYKEQLATYKTGTVYKKRFVANLSFGLQCPPLLTDEEQEQFDKEVKTISGHVESLIHEGVVVVAAAGNTEYLSPALPPELFPASLPDVISVGSNNHQKDFSCFTHNADVFAPGGEGNPNTDNGICEPNYYHCPSDPTEPADGGCSDGILSFVTDTDSPTGLAYWSGTSFATPLVAGLVALRLDEHNFTPDLLVDVDDPNPTYKVVDVEKIEDEVIDKVK